MNKCCHEIIYGPEKWYCQKCGITGTSTSLREEELKADLLALRKDYTDLHNKLLDQNNDNYNLRTELEAARKVVEAVGSYQPFWLKQKGFSRIAEAKQAYDTLKSPSGDKGEDGGKE